jgi:two-component system, cell cycle sensor histidine kinase and response regulator CckA
VSKGSILLVDDDDIVRDVTRAILEASGYEVTDAPDGARALELVADGQFDLVLADLVMPVMPGPELAREVLRRYPTLPILFMSGYADGYEHQVDSRLIVPKPFTIAVLRERVRAAIDAVSGPPDERPAATNSLASG